MITGKASAKLGKFQDGAANVALKSGADEFHGALFEDVDGCTDMEPGNQNVNRGLGFSGRKPRFVDRSSL